MINSKLQEHSVMFDEEDKNYMTRIIWAIVLMFNLVIFILTKFGMLKLTLNVRSILQNPQDILFCIDEMEKLIVTPICTAIVVYDLIYSNKPPFTNDIPNCGIRILPLLLPNIMFFGGVAIALMRCITIRHTHIVAKLGEFKIMVAILVLWQSLLIGNTYLMAVNSMDEYKNRCYNKEESSISFPPAPIFVLACGTEFAIYISICQYIYKSDIEIKQFISPESYGRRKRRNAFNVFGYIIYFLLELLVMILGTTFYVYLKIPLKLWYLLTSTILAIAMLLLSKPLKMKWTQLLLNLQVKFRKRTSINDSYQPRPTEIDHYSNIALEMGSTSKKR